MHRFLRSVLCVFGLTFLSCAPAARSSEDPPPEQDDTTTCLLTRLGHAPFWHGSTTCGVAFSGDGKLFASAHHDELIRLWDPKTGKELRRLKGHDGSVFAVALSPDGKRLASVGKDATTRIWDPQTGKQLDRFDHTGATNAVVFSPDGSKLAVGDQCGTIYVWATDTGKKLHQIAAHKASVQCLRFSPDSKEFASGAHDGKVCRWKSATAEGINSFQAYTDPVYSVAYSPDGKMLSTGSSTGAVSTWILETGKESQKFHVGQFVWAVPFTADMKSLVVASYSSSGVQMIDLETGKIRSCDLGVPGDEVRIVGLALALGGNYFIAGGEANRLCCVDTTTLKPLERSRDEFHGPVSCLSISPDGKTVACGGHASDVCVVSECRTGKQLHALKAPLGLGSLAHSPDGHYLVGVTRKENFLRLWDATSGDAIDDFNDQKRRARSVVFAPGNHLRGLCPDQKLRAWTYPLGKQNDIAELAFEQSDVTLLSPDGTRVALLDLEGKRARIQHLGDSRTPVRLKGECYGPVVGCFSADGKVLAVGQIGGRINVWNADTGALAASWQTDDHWIRAIALSPDGRTLAIGRRSSNIHHDEYEIQMYEVCTHRLRGRLCGHSNYVIAMAFAGDGSLLASGSLDETCIVWDLTGRRVAKVGPSAPLGEKEIGRLWDVLRGDEVRAAWRAGWELVAAGDSVAAFMKERLTAAERIGRDRIAKLITDLDNDEFKVREGASKELNRIGYRAVPALLKTLENEPSLEVRRRIDELLESIGRVPRGELLRHLRAVEVLEQIGTGDARRLLEKLAAGDDDDTVTQEAKASLDRLTRKR